MQRQIALAGLLAALLPIIVLAAPPKKHTVPAKGTMPKGAISL